MVRTIFVGLGLVAAAVAQSSSYTGPMFNPSDAPFFGSSALVIPTLTQNVPSTLITPTFIRSRTSSAGSVSRSTQVSSLTSNSVSRSSSASVSASSSASASASASASRTSNGSVSGSSTASASAAAQSTGAACMNYPGVMGVVAGGLVAGLAMA